MFGKSIVGAQHKLVVTDPPEAVQPAAGPPSCAASAPVLPSVAWEESGVASLAASDTRLPSVTSESEAVPFPSVVAGESDAVSLAASDTLLPSVVSDESGDASSAEEGEELALHPPRARTRLAPRTKRFMADEPTSRPAPVQRIRRERSVVAG